MSTNPPKKEPAKKDTGSNGIDRLRTVLGFVLAVVGMVIVAIVFAVAVNTFKTATDVAAVVGAVTGVIGTIVAAFFGINVAASGQDKANDTAQQAQENTKAITNKGMAAALLADGNNAQAQQLVAEFLAM